MNVKELRQRLLVDKQELQTRLSKIEADLEKGRSRDWSEQAQERENDDVLDSLSAEATQQLDKINRALSKIDNNTYGQCESCHKAISESRLQALPTAELCMECAS